VDRRADCPVPDRDLRRAPPSLLSAHAVSGLRRGEAAGLRWCDIDFAGTVLTVSRQLQETSRGLVLLPPKSIAGNRVLALDPWTLQVLAPTAIGSSCRRGGTGTSIM
jgi:integrase